MLVVFHSKRVDLGLGINVGLLVIIFENKNFAIDNFIMMSGIKPSYLYSFGIRQSDNAT